VKPPELLRLVVKLEKRFNTPSGTLEKKLWPVIGVMVCLSRVYSDTTPL